MPQAAAPGFDSLRARIAGLTPVRRTGRISELAGGLLQASGLAKGATLGDRVEIRSAAGDRVGGEILRLSAETVTILCDGDPEGLAIGDRVTLLGPARIAPDDSWIGRIVDPFGAPLDARPLFPGLGSRPLRTPAPAAATRHRMGGRLATGVAVFDTLLPLVRGQRIGLFAGSGVGKSSLLAKFARGVAADIVVIALIGERGRELREFVEEVLGPEGMARSVVVAATSDQSPLVRRRCAWAAMAVAEHFRDQGRQVLLLADSVTRFAEAHREVALAAGENASLRGYPPSTAHMIMSLAERAGPGRGQAGDITAVFSVLVPGSDMEEPVADILRGVLDGHVVMDRKIAERGRFPAIDLLRSVSRALPEAADAAENRLIKEARALLGAYDRAEMMIQAGLYAPGSDPMVDAALKVWPALDAFLAEDAPDGVAESFARLETCLAPARPRA
ncbi:ATP synthase [Defluviimonas sp. 20V17]|uniref:ATP synthase n=1 Tax=Allgaiera indica TaxID=765699 RepID=A0AAN5A0A2_9RHOB|nr:FliI/YscN family ATPase [Allgaiera indica]KDB02692.1 ATP synthase [Defluviimonas sp. 20V17]GHE01776.1 ATP synthase [Allgaiera indica]SDW93184.1 flagellum-specific ATP synthase [Allgaiera indica]